MINHRSPRQKRSNTGFTLIEMTIVLLIIGILMGIAIPSYLTAREKSRASVCRGQLRQIQDAKERWAIDKRKGSEDIPTPDDLAPNYLKDIPLCPAGGTYTFGKVGDNPTCSEPGHSLY
jgi:prepilin-type N-terminal cleavage/methylation domain-containing protein